MQYLLLLHQMGLLFILTQPVPRTLLPYRSVNNSKSVNNCPLELLQLPKSYQASTESQLSWLLQELLWNGEQYQFCLLFNKQLRRWGIDLFLFFFTFVIHKESLKGDFWSQIFQWRFLLVCFFTLEMFNQLQETMHFFCVRISFISQKRWYRSYK